jgi:Peptidase family S41
MRKPFAILLFLSGILSPNKLYCQDCSCRNSFEYLYDKISKNYIGFRDKVTPSTQRQFNKFTDSLRKATDGADSLECYAILKLWTSYFKDGHLDFYWTDQAAIVRQLKQHLPNFQRISISEEDFQQYLSINKSDGIEGIWEDRETNCRIGVIRDTKNRQLFHGFVLQWNTEFSRPGQIRFSIQQLKGNQYQTNVFFPADHTPLRPTVYVNKRRIYFKGFATWHKISGAGSDNSIIQPERNETDIYMPLFRQIDKNTCLLTIPAFFNEYGAAIDSLLEFHKNTISNTPNLIIDIRDNPGGYITTFRKLLTFISTGSIVREGGYSWSTPDNINELRKLLNDSTLSEKARSGILSDIKNMELHEGKIFQSSKNDTLEIGTINKYPARVAVLMNRSTVSAAELFILQAKQSKKVILIGEPSYGAVDYLDFSGFIPMPCRSFAFSYPFAKRNGAFKRSFDNSGIPPNVFIPESTNDWVFYAKSILEKKHK